MRFRMVLKTKNAHMEFADLNFVTYTQPIRHLITPLYSKIDNNRKTGDDFCNILFPNGNAIIFPCSNERILARLKDIETQVRM